MRGVEVYLQHSYTRQCIQVNSELHAPATLTMGKLTPYPFYEIPGGSQNRSQHCAEEKKITPAGNLEVGDYNPDNL